MALHPYLAQQSFTDWQRHMGIQLIQFSPLGNQNDFYKHAQDMPKLIEDLVLQTISKRHGKSPVQIVLAWGILKGRCVIPKSTIKWQLAENLESDTFDLEGSNIERMS